MFPASRAFLASLVSTRRRKRAVTLGLAAVLSPVWAAAGAPVPGSGPRPPAAPVDAGTAAAIRAGRPAGYPVGGIDISGHDHQRFGVRWATEAAAGSQFVYIKATEGTTYVNPYLERDTAGARAAGRYVGAYAYARPDRGNPVGQAEFFLSHLQAGRDGRTLLPFVDLEWPYAGVKTDRCYNLNPAQMRSWIHAFVGRVEAGIGRKPMIYTNAYWWNPCTGNDGSFGRYPLDLSSYTKKSPRLPAGWTEFTLWQYVPGDPTRRDDHDRDVVSGGVEGLKKLVWSRSAADR